jgi:hypothetical protein
MDAKFLDAAVTLAKLWMTVGQIVPESMRWSTFA